MNWKKALKGIAIGTGTAIGVLILLIVVVMVSGVTIQLDFIRPAVEKGAAEALGRPVRISGAIELTPTLRPTVAVSGVTVDNPTGWDEKAFVTIDLARTQIDIPDLLAREITIGEITAEGVSLNLVSETDGRNNWQLAEEAADAPSTKTEAPKPPSPKVPAEDEKRIRFTALDRLSLQRIAVRYRDKVLDKTVDFRIDDFSGSAKEGEPVNFAISGSLQGREYRFDVDGGSLANLRDKKSTWPLKLGGEVVGTPVEVTGELDRQGEEPLLHFGFSLGKVDIGGLIVWLGLLEDVKASTDRFAMEAKLVGDSLHELIARSEMSMTLEGGQWTLQDRNTQAELPIRIVDGTIRVAPDQPVSLKVNGEIDRTPVSFTIEGMPLAEYVSGPEELKIHIGAEAAGAELTLDGKMTMPARAKDASLELNFQGESLASLDELIHVDLPPFGPYRLKARFAVVESGYELSDLRLAVGDSELDGEMKLDTSGDTPRVDIQLTSKRLQLDDFAVGEWSPAEPAAASEKPPAAEEASETEAKPKGGKPAASLLSPRVLNALDAAMNIEVQQVLSGTDNLGGGRLDLALQDGKLSVEPLRLDVPGGSVQLGFSFRPTETDATVHVEAAIERFDVGILVRRIDPEKKLGGLLNLDVQLDGTAPDPRQLMANAKGHFDFAFWPENLGAEIVDLWAVNLITVLSQKADGEADSTLNCVVAKFDLTDGLMQEKAIFMDTTRMSISGDSTINFKTEKIDVLAAPKAKRPEFFSLATPVKIQGTFSDFGIGINKLSLAKTAVSFITSPITVPFKRLFAKEVPADGKAACEEAWQMELTNAESPDP